MATVYAVGSAKGGVGKTTTTAALATLLADAGRDVVAIDADLGMANLAGTLGVEVGETTVHDVLAGRASATDAVEEGPCGLRVVPGSSDVDAYAEVDPAGMRDVVAAFGDAEYVILDGAAGLSHDSVLPLTLADETLLVSTPEHEALADTQKTAEVTQRLGGSITGAVITRVDPDGHERGLVSELLEAAVLAEIPEDPTVREARRAEEPLVTYDRHAPSTRAYRTLAAALTGERLPEPEPLSDADARAESDPGEELPGTTEGSGESDETGSDPLSEQEDAATEPETDDESESITEPEIDDEPAAIDAEADVDADDEYGSTREPGDVPETETDDGTDDETEPDDGAVEDDEAELDEAIGDDEAIEDETTTDKGGSGYEVLGEPIDESEFDTDATVEESVPFRDDEEEDADGTTVPDEEDTAIPDAEGGSIPDEEDETDTTTESDPEDETDDEKKGFFRRLFGR